MDVPSHEQPPLPLRWCSALDDPSGYADEARAFLIALDRAGRGAAATPLPWTDLRTELPPAHRDAIARAKARPAPSPSTLVYHLVPGGKLPPNPDGPIVLRTMFESDRVPEAWLPRLAEVDEIWVPCAFNLETFARGGIAPRRLHRLPETIDFDLFAPAARERPAEQPFTFLTSFDFTDRKGWDVLLDAWADAFDANDPVRLQLKCFSIHGIASEVISARIAQHLDGRSTAPIELELSVLPVYEMPRLYAGADAFVLASRGEGWGRPYMEAMAMGLPTIGSRWSGNLDFMHDGNAWLVDGELVPVSEAAQQHTPLYRGHRWFEPDRDALVHALRDVAAGGPAVAARAAAARTDLLARFGPDPTAARLVELAEGALERWRERRSRPVALAWRGDWSSVHSLAVVNEAIANAVEESGRATVVRRGVDGDVIHAGSVGVAQQWPPSFEAPTDGPFVLYQPWEFGEIPQSWVEPIRTRVDEVWTPSEYARRSFLAAGVAPELVHVVPNGVDLERFTPAGPRRRLATRAGTVFLFVGGTTYRKGIDVLLDAYGRAFDSRDDVCLVLKGFGSQTLYRGQTAEGPIGELQARPGAPEVVLLDDDLPFEEIPALYRAADCLVQPYRGEGFCLPALEALACGVPVIVTAGGPTDDFTSDACAWRIASHPQALPPEALPDRHAPAGGGFMLEPDVNDLVAALRCAVDPVLRRQKAHASRSHAERFSWSAAAARAVERIEALSGRVPIRTVAPATIEERRRVLLAVEADWAESGSWAPAVRAYAAAFGADDDVTLLLPAAAAEAASLVEQELLEAGASLDTLADLVLADPAGLDGDALALAADAYVCSGPVHPARARRVIAADPSALKSFLLETT